MCGVVRESFLSLRTNAPQVQVSSGKLAAKYRKARQSIRAAADAAESAKRDREHKAAQAEKLKVRRHDYRFECRVHLVRDCSASLGNNKSEEAARKIQ